MVPLVGPALLLSIYSPDQAEQKPIPARPASCERAELPCSLHTVYYEGLQDKLAQIRDARGALSALREEHREKLRRAAEEAERQRQIQLAQKLEIMRQKKQVWHPTWHMGRGGPGWPDRLLSVAAGVPGGAEAVGYPAPAGAGEGAADAPGATEADCPDARPDACLPLALCPGMCCPPRFAPPGPSTTPLTVGSSLFLAPGYAHSWGCALPALRPNQLSWHLQPSRLSRGLPNAWCVHEPASPSHWPIPQHAWQHSR